MAKNKQPRKVRITRTNAPKMIKNIDAILSRGQRTSEGLTEGQALEEWTVVVNKVVDILKLELNSGFLENTSKYEGGDEKLVYSCLRAIAVQIVNIPEITNKELGYSSPQEVKEQVKQARREERERIAETIKAEIFDRDGVECVSIPKSALKGGTE